MQKSMQCSMARRPDHSSPGPSHEYVSRTPVQARLAEGDDERSMLASQANSLAQKLREAEAVQAALRNEGHSAAEHRDAYEHAVRERNADLAAMRDELQHALQVGSDTTTGMHLPQSMCDDGTQQQQVQQDCQAQEEAIGSGCRSRSLPSRAADSWRWVQDQEATEQSLRDAGRRNKQLLEDQAAANTALEVR